MVVASLLVTLATRHPQVLPTQERFDWFKAQIAANPTGNQPVWYNNKLLTRANAILADPVNCYDSSSKSLLVGHADDLDSQCHRQQGIQSAHHRGAWYAGSAHWGYSARHLVRMLSGMKSVVGSDFGSFSSKKVCHDFNAFRRARSIS